MLRILPMPVAQYKIDGRDLFTSGQMQNYAIDCQEAAKEEALAQLEQEPVAWVCRGVYSAIGHCPECQPLYTAPPKREWVGLDEKEVSWLWFYMGNREKINGYDFAKAIEAKLKEKNV